MKRLNFCFILLFIFTPYFSFCQFDEFTNKAQKLILNFNTYHYKPILINEASASDVVQLFVNDLDGTGFIFMKSDVEMLEKDASQFFNLIYANDNSYAKHSLNIYSFALNRLDSILNSIAEKPLNFTVNDTLQLFPYSTKVHYSENIKSFAKYIENNIKYSAMLKVHNSLGFEELNETEYNNKAQEISKKVIERLRKRLLILKSMATEDIESSLLNSIALRYDPHSNYFTQQQEKSFIRMLSKDVDSFGFILDDDNDGNIFIAYIEPGGSAWMSNDVHEGDYFVSLKIDNLIVTNEENSLEEVQYFLDNSKDKKLVLSLKKQNGQYVTVKLIKQKAASVENTVKGYILQGDAGNYGYISLPNFYTDMSDTYSPGCANDVAKELLKMEGDSIKGLILDLRNNGGGSMLEAMNLAGIFVDEGPLFIYKKRDQKPQLFKDINRGSIFKKPIVVLINENSASASELFCNIVKDYNLGLVVGQTSYGKGTSQFIIPLDSTQLKQKSARKESIDYLKITTSGFYRLNCQTHQGDGVEPDVFLPAIPGYVDSKENKEMFYIKADTIVKKIVFNPKDSINVDLIRIKSKNRIQSSSDFNRYKQSADSMNLVISNPKKIVLKYKDFKKYYTESNNMHDSFSNACKTVSKNIVCMNNTFDHSVTNLNEYTKEFNQNILESIQEDIFINECYYIINDLINLTK